MADSILTEQPLQFGEGGRLFGILTLPSVTYSKEAMIPAFVFLNAGLMHRVGPYRLYVRLSRELGKLGFPSLRVDLSGTGDSPPCPALTNHQSVEADFKAIRSVLDSHLGAVPLVLAGLCTGADNVISLTLREARVIGMILLDPFCFPDRMFNTRVFVKKYMNPARYIRWIVRRLKASTHPHGIKQVEDEAASSLSFRDLPTRDQLRAAFALIGERDGRVLSIFTRWALEYYNRRGQLGRALGVNGYQQFCTELFWPHAEHTYRLDLHRRRLIEEIKSWAGHYIHPKITTKTDTSLEVATDRITRAPVEPVKSVENFYS